MRLIQNLKFLMARDGYNPHSLAAASGVKQPTIFRILEGESLTPRDSTIRPLAEFFGVTIDQLRYGDLSGSEPNITPGPDFGGQVPIISYVQAGEFCDAEDPFAAGQADEWLPFKPPSAGPCSYALRVEGDSNDPRIRNGEIVVVDPDKAAEPGSFVVAKRHNDGKVTLKQLKYDEGQPYLKAANPNWPEPIVRVDGDWSICGVVICKVEMF